MKRNMQARRAASKQSKKDRKRPASDTASCSHKADKIAKHAPKTGGIVSKPKKAKISKSVQDEPNASETYKSLFTSSDEAKKQNSQHSGWVSFNPQYFR